MKPILTYLFFYVFILSHCLSSSLSMTTIPPQFLDTHFVESTQENLDEFLSMRVRLLTVYLFHTLTEYFY
ncbi:hypothetical protein DICVIV_13005 [Dictyocaulus viviparus]|uniref:Uncharacterized protein n=1 Tax=Dictyocaulus viviparus TaxID=29172 RepID=A0A0D8X8Z2_DICVI|nr:hypothetical protein DICVIV_13005 [Dictyocaulus viviparus]